MGTRNCSACNAGESGLISQRGRSLIVFLELLQEAGLYSQVTERMATQNSFLFTKAGLLSTYEGNLRNLHEAWQGNTDTSRGKVGDRVSLSSCTVIFGFLSIFKKSQASSPFEALNYTCLSSCQTDVRPPVQMRRGPRAFSRASIGDSDSPSSCEMKYEPAFKPLQGNPAFF